VTKQFLRKRQVAQRYGNITPRSVERAVEDGRIPAPVYPFGPHSPMWDLEELERNERAAAIRGTSKSDWRDRFLAELTTAPRNQASAILQQYNDLINALPADEREKLLAAAQDIIAEKTDN
jgi:hypothetical protein